jgi:hypothetical protein
LAPLFLTTGRSATRPRSDPDGGLETFIERFLP